MQPVRKPKCRPALFGSPAHTAPMTRLVAGGMLSLLATLPLSASAQSGRNTSPQRGIAARVTTATAGVSLNISAESAPYHLDWNGTTGLLTRRALGNQPELRLPLTYLHSEPGPKGYSKHLAWFLARDKDHFSIVWCYLNDGGREFYCWLYQFPTNQLTTLRFVGDYRFAPLPEPVAPAAIAELNTQVIPSYTGPDFKFRDWTRRSGKLDALQLTPATQSFAASLTESNMGEPTQSTIHNPQSTIENSRSLSALRVYPLHEIQVAKGNGWRAGGWRELHALAFDSANDPYYLIQYSNVTKGYVVDLKRAQTYVTDFGARVVFSNDNTVFGAKEETIVGPPDARVRRYARTEIPLVTTHQYDNAYNNVDLYMDFRGPDGKTVTVPGYWDGGQTWRVRFTPTQVGKWTWRSYSTDTEMGDQVGSFTCVAEDNGSKGFVTVNGQRFYPHAFASANGQPFFPVFLRDPVHYFPASDTSPSVPTAPKTPAGRETASLNLIVPAQDAPAAKPTAPNAGVDDPALMDLTSNNTPRTFINFARRVDDAAALGFNRFWGGWLLDPTLFAQHTQSNEGGAPFVNYDLDSINPAYFQWMDRRIAYCNERGVVPDIGISDISAPLLTQIKPEQVSRLWKYVLARYSAFNVNWNLFGKSPNNPYPPDVDAWVEPLARMTDKYDPAGHPLTIVVPNAAPLVTSPAPPAKPTVFRPDNPVIIRPDAPNGVPDVSNPAAPTPGRFPSGAQTPTLPGNPAATDTPGTPGSANPRGGSRRGTGAGGTLPGGNTSGTTAPSRNSAGGQNPGRGAANGSRTGTDPSTRANGAFPQNPNFPGFPAGTTFPNRSAMGSMGQGMSADQRAQARANRGRGRNRGGFGSGAAGSANGDFTGGSEITGNTTQNDYVTIVDPQVAASLRAERLGHQTAGAPISIPVVRYASDSWLDVVTLSGGDIGVLTIDYRLNKPLVIQDVAGKEPTDETRHRLWETIMRGGYWQGATTANSGVADPLSSVLARWQLGAARLLAKNTVCPAFTTPGYAGRSG